jgi:hypothetical protein
LLRIGSFQPNGRQERGAAEKFSPVYADLYFFSHPNYHLRQNRLPQASRVDTKVLHVVVSNHDVFIFQIQNVTPIGGVSFTVPGATFHKNYAVNAIFSANLVPTSSTVGGTATPTSRLPASQGELFARSEFKLEVRRSPSKEFERRTLITFHRSLELALDL